MSEILEDVQAKLAVNGAATDSLIALCLSIKGALDDAIANNANGASAEELQALSDVISAETTRIQATIAAASEPAPVVDEAAADAEEAAAQAHAGDPTTPAE